MQIKGVGPRTAARLRDSGIKTFDQLSTLKSEEIASRVPGISSKRVDRENWVRQAQRLAQKQNPMQADTKILKSDIHQHYATFTIELLLNKDNSIRRTRVTEVQTNVQESWADWSESKLMDFISRSACLSAPARKVTTHSGVISHSESLPLPKDVAISVPAQNIEPEITIPESKASLVGRLQVYELTTTFPHSDTPQTIAQANKPFNVHLELDLREVKFVPFLRLLYTVTVWAKRFGMATRHIVGEKSGMFIPIERIPCDVEAVIPSPGRYRLEAIITLISEGNKPSPQYALRAWKESSLLQVY